MRPFAKTLLLAMLSVATGTLAQPPGDTELLHDRAFDVVVLKDGQSQRILPLDDRRPRAREAQPAAGWLKVRLVSQPGADLEVAWGEIERVDLFEQLLLRRGLELTREKDFDKAFGFFARLHNEHADTPGLADATERYLLGEANAAYRAADYDKTVALLLNLNDRYPDSPTLSRAVDAVAGKLIDQRVAERDFRGARDQLDIVQQRFSNLELAVVSRWQERFRGAADAKSAEGERLLAAGDYRAALAAAEQAITVWPSHRPSRRLMSEIDRLYPAVKVAVTVPSLPPNAGAEQTRIDMPARLRTAPLVAPRLTQLVGYSGAGGRYATPLGEIVLDDTARYLEVIARGNRTPYTLARWLSRVTTPGRAAYRSDLAEVVSTLRVDAPDRVVMTLHRPHFRPEALFKGVSLAELGFNAGVETTNVGAKVVQRDTQRLIAELVAADSRTIKIEETVFTNDEAAVAALGRRAVDLVANVPPWRLKSLRENQDIKVERYLLPTVHALIPTKRLPLLDEREFRRGLLYGIDRERILGEVLLAGGDEPGYRVTSGPFPYGASLADPVRYGYNDAVSPRPYDPRLSAILTAVAWNKTQQDELRKQGRDEEAPADTPLPPLRIAHTSDPLARTACQAIQLQLQGLGYEIELMELDEPSLVAADPDFEFRYAELTVGEPVVDAHTLLGPSGLTGRCTDAMRAALRRLNEATNTKEVQIALFEVHRLANSDLPLLPLWQTTKHLAYRDGLVGLPDKPASLYQNVAAWRKSFSTEQ